MGEVNLIVARANFRTGVELVLEAPAEIRVRPGDVIKAKVPFRFYEVSHDREDFELHFFAGPKGLEPDQESHIHHDKPMRADDHRGMLMLSHRVESAGTSELEFRVEAQFFEGGWDSSPRTLEQTKDVSCTVRVVAR